MPRKDRLDIARKRILLVGATGVLGRVYAEELAARGASLVIADRPGSGVQVLAAELPGKVAAVEIDVADEASVTRAVREAVDFLGGLDAAISNAAATSEGLIGKGNAFAPFEEYPLSVFQEVIQVNLLGTFLVARESGRVMKEMGGGSLINVSSIYGLVGPDHRMYEGL